jgi:hypothetical protein
MNTNSIHSAILAYGQYRNTPVGIETLIPLADADLDRLATEYGTETRAQRLEKALRAVLDSTDSGADAMAHAIRNAEYALESAD